MKHIQGDITPPTLNSNCRKLRLGAENPRYLPFGIMRAAICVTVMVLATINGNAQIGSITSSATDARTPSGLAGGSETINPYNGSMTYTLPLLNIGGRGEAGYTLVLPIKQQWIVRHTSSNYQCVNDPHCTGPFHSYRPEFNWKEGIAPGFSPGVLQGRRGGGLVYSTPVSYGEFGGVGHRILPPGAGYTGISVTGTQNTLTRLIFTTNDGSEIELVDRNTEGQPNSMSCTTQTSGFNRGRTFISKDGSAMTFVSDTDVLDMDCSSANPYGSSQYSPVFQVSGYLYTKNGLVYRFDNGRVSWMRDRNGNDLRFTYNTSGTLSTVTDSLNRQVTFNYVPDAYTQITYKGFSGQERIIRLYADYLTNILRPGQTLKTKYDLFPSIPHDDNPPSDFNPYLVSAVELPDGRRYHFYYDSYGELARVETPTGAATEYDFDVGTERLGFSPQTDTGSGAYKEDVEINIYRRVIEHRLYPDGGTGSNYERKTTYSRKRETYTQAANGTMTLVSSENVGFVTVDQKDASGNLLTRSKHYYNGDPLESFFNGSFNPSGYNRWNEGTEYRTEHFAADGVTVLRRIEQQWQQRAPISWWASFCSSNQSFNYCYPSAATVEPPNDPRVISLTTTFTDTNQVTRQEFSYDNFNNLTDTYEYDFDIANPGSLLRRTHIDYVTDASYTSETGAHLRSLPLQRWVSSDALGNYKSVLTQYEYDNYTSDIRHNGLLSRANISGLCLLLDASGNCATASTISYTTRGNLTGSTSYVNAAGQSGPVTTSAQYDVAGNAIKTIDGRGYATAFDFSDRFGTPDGEARSNNTAQLIELSGQATYAFATSMDNALGHTSYNQYDYYLGAPVNAEDSNGVISSTTYSANNTDKLDRPSQSINALNTSLQSQTNTSYDDINRVVTVRTDVDTYGDNKLKNETLYDKIGRTIETHSYAGTTFITSRQEYDALGRAKRVYNPFRAMTDDTYGWTTTTYDALSRVTQVQTSDRNGATTGLERTDYSGSQVLVTDQANHQRLRHTNAVGQLVDVWEVAPNNATSYPGIEATSFNAQALYGYSTHYEYDVLGNLTKVTQGSQTPRIFLYNSLKQLTDATNPESGHVSYDYDENGNLKHKTDARNIVTVYDYDELDRVISKTYQNDGGLTQPVYYKYDSQGLPGGAPSFDRGQSNGRLVALLYGSSNSATGNYQGYDELGRVKRSFQVTNDGQTDQTYTFSNYGYDLRGNLRSETYPSGRIVSTEYYADGKLSNVSGWKPGEENKTYISQIGYVATGAIKDLQLGNGLWEQNLFNSRLQPTEIRLGTTPGGTDRLKLSYSYGTTNDNGNVLSQTITVPTIGSTDGFTVIQSYGYDAFNRLLSAEETNGSTQMWKQSYAYDRFGNRRIDTGTDEFGKKTSDNARPPDFANPTIGPANNQFSVNQGYDYDAAGNLTTTPNRYDQTKSYKYEYDAENRQTCFDRDPVATPNVKDAIYVYDGDGRRVKKIADGVTTIFVYNASGELISEYSAGGSSGNGTSYLTSDALGTPRVITGSNINDAQGGVKVRHDYLPFGDELLVGRNGAYLPDNIRQKFTGKERDTETGLDYFVARYYSSIQGRFASVDPENAGATLDNPQSWNGYSYAMNNPLLFIDPDGRDVEVFWKNSTIWYKPSEFERFKSQLESEGFTVKDGKIFSNTYDEDGNLTVNQIGTYISDTNPTAERLFREMPGRADALMPMMHVMWIYMSFFTLPAAEGTPMVGLLSKASSTCFVSGTPILTRDGLKPIEEVKVGDAVASYNTQAKQVEYKPVVQTFARYAEQVLSVQVEGEAVPLGVTPKHPFYVRVHRARDNTRSDEDEGEWREAGQIRIGDQVKLASGGWARVLEVERRTAGAAVYNFETADNHNYFVGQAGLLVHNLGDCLPLIVKAVNSEIIHASKRAVDHGFFSSVREAAEALRGLSKQITASGLPAGAIRDTAHADRVLVPLKDGAYAVYQVAANGTAKLKTVLIAR